MIEFYIKIAGLMKICMSFLRFAKVLYMMIFT